MPGGLEDIRCSERSMKSMDIEEVFDDEHSNILMKGKKLRTVLVVIAVLSFLLTILIVVSHVGVKTHDAAPPIQLQCPLTVRHADNVNDADFDYDYASGQEERMKNMTAFLENLGNQTFDAWHRPYDQFKAGMLDWKRKHYRPPNIHSGGSIYESACGIGMNMLMTLEIMKEYAGITDIQVYGNDYMSSSTNKANFVMDHMHPGRSQKGQICTADSTDLVHVPSNAFDLVFTGYISTLLDPLEFNTGSTSLNFKRYDEVCKSLQWRDVRLAELAQEKQDNWYGKWIAEMVRIAKPGGAVIIEQVSNPRCATLHDLGGVSRDSFWTNATFDKYGWDVDPTSLDIQDDSIFHHTHRYHVFLRKNKNNNNAAL